MDLRKHSRLLGKELNNLLADIEKGIGIEVSELPPKQLIPIGARFLLKESGVTKEYIKLNDGEYHLLGGGGSGTDAREIQLQKSVTHIQWRYEGETTWTDLVALSEITGETGATGATGLQGEQGIPGTPGDDGQEIQLRVDSGYIQWKYENDISWTNLIAQTELKGDTGETGSAGQGIDHVSFTSSTGTGQGEPGETDTYTVWGDAGETINLGTFTVYNGDDGSGSGLTDAPSDGKTYGRKDANWVEVVTGVSPYERIADYIEVDASNLLTVHSERVLWTAASSQTYYMYKDFGVDNFDADFEINFTFYWLSLSANTSVNYMLLLTRNTGTLPTLSAANEDLLTVFFNKTAGGAITLGIRELNGGAIATTTDTTLTTNTFYFATLDRDESIGTYGQLRLRVYSDYTRSTLIATLTLSLSEKQDFRYLELSSTAGAAGAAYGLIEDIEIVSA
jgi:hypothetical protein